MSIELSTGIYAFFQTIFLMLKILLPFIAIAFVFDLLRRLPDIIRSYRARKTGISELDTLSGREFEIWLATFFKRMGYRVKLLKGFKDSGADLIVIDHKGHKWAAQAKKRTGSNVGVSAIDEVLRGKNYYECDFALVVTNTDFTKQAQEEAEACKVVLWNHQRLISIAENIANKRS